MTQVMAIQHRNDRLMQRAGQALVAMLDEIAITKKSGASEAQLLAVQNCSVKANGGWTS